MLENMKCWGITEAVSGADFTSDGSSAQIISVQTCNPVHYNLNMMLLLR